MGLLLIRRQRTTNTGGGGGVFAVSWILLHLRWAVWGTTLHSPRPSAPRCIPVWGRQALGAWGPPVAIPGRRAHH